MVKIWCSLYIRYTKHTMSAAVAGLFCVRSQGCYSPFRVNFLKGIDLKCYWMRVLRQRFEFCLYADRYDKMYFLGTTIICSF